jgi:hypothetical protein
LARWAAANKPANEFKDIPDLFDQIAAQTKGGFKFEAARAPPSTRGVAQPQQPTQLTSLAKFALTRRLSKG